MSFFELFFIIFTVRSVDLSGKNLNSNSLYCFPQITPFKRLRCENY